MKVAPAIYLRHLDHPGVGAFDAAGEGEPDPHGFLAGAGDRRRGTQTLLGLDAEGELLFDVRAEQGWGRTVLQVAGAGGHADGHQGGQGYDARKEVTAPAGPGRGDRVDGAVRRCLGLQGGPRLRPGIRFGHPAREGTSADRLAGTRVPAGRMEAGGTNAH